MNEPKLLLVGIDGLRIDDIGRTRAAPALESLMDEGITTRITMEVPTISGPGWASLLTGATHAEHGVFDNTFAGHTMFRNADLLSRIFYADQTRTTFAAAGWPALVDPTLDPIISFRADQQRHGQHKVVVRDGELRGYEHADAEVAEAACEWIAGAGPHASFVYFCETDQRGHESGALSDAYGAAIRRIDGYLGRLVAIIKSRATQYKEDWLVAVTTDHGHLDQGGHGGSEPVLTRSFLAVARFNASSAPTREGIGLERAIAPHEVWRPLAAHVLGANSGG